MISDPYPGFAEDVLTVAQHARTYADGEVWSAARRLLRSADQLAMSFHQPARNPMDCRFEWNAATISDGDEEDQ